MSKRYQVTGACITHVPVTTSQGTTLITLYKDAMLPADVPADRIKHLLESNLIAEVDDAPAADTSGDSGSSSRQGRAKQS